MPLGINLLFAILITFFIIWLIALPQEREFIVAYGTLIGSLTLVLVTMNYTIVTIELLKETQKDRQVRWIENRLRNLYYPLQNSMTSSSNLHRYVRDLSNMLYLADEQLEGELRRFSELDIAETVGELIVEGREKTVDMQKKNS
nr:hypothetical protein [Candidatus Njordarchaeota archaeon]